jgi:hypothetical protein
MALDEAVDLGLNGLHQHPTSTLAQQTKQRVILDDPAWSRQADNGILLHGGRILSNGDFSNSCNVLIAKSITFQSKGGASIDFTGDECRSNLPSAVPGRVALLE